MRALPEDFRELGFYRAGREVEVEPISRTDVEAKGERLRRRRLATLLDRP